MSAPPWERRLLAAARQVVGATEVCRCGCWANDPSIQALKAALAEEEEASKP